MYLFGGRQKKERENETNNTDKKRKRMQTKNILFINRPLSMFKLQRNTDTLESQDTLFYGKHFATVFIIMMYY